MYNICNKHKNMSRRPQKTSAPRGRSSNYAYGRSAEKSVGQKVKQISNGTYQHRSPGSRGPSDVTVYKNHQPAYDIQVKSSRASASAQNRASSGDTKKIIAHAKSNGTVPLIANVSGGHKHIIYAKSGKTMYRD